MENMPPKDSYDELRAETLAELNAFGNKYIECIIDNEVLGVLLDEYSDLERDYNSIDFQRLAIQLLAIDDYLKQKKGTSLDTLLDFLKDNYPNGFISNFNKRFVTITIDMGE